MHWPQIIAICILAAGFLATVVHGLRNETTDEATTSLLTKIIWVMVWSWVLWCGGFWSQA